ncbi:hypothetical protein QWJ26_13340 [Streptomyces sp. CSDS2]|uniref:hypothetical protein n=1 Tax=Streptomyces sp. CSDS2 TaxID=3055051 RepID=UPI0025B16E94|nr:hypothetical protein [Streptomyces sp. CSDS2]MDN3260779.1 hypothetical protein [Streptomyces sp. CSDS2]
MINLKHRAVVAAASLALATGGFLATSATTATAAAAGPNCTEWYDENTFGVTCSGGASGKEVRAVAECGNGATVYGQWKSAVTGGWSYAYCAGKGGLYDGKPQLRG